MDDPLAAAKRVLASFAPDEQVELYRFLRRRLGRAPTPTRHVAAAAARRGGSVTFREERVKCGRDACRCARGELHGPYVYKYWREGGRLRKKYVGKPGVTRPS